MKRRRIVRRPTSMIEALTVAVALAIPLAVMPLMAQAGKPDPGPEEERMPGMMRMMQDMPLAPKDPKSGR